MENLFDNPTTLRDPEHFIGRREQLERIFGLIKARQNVSLVGPRRIGKTSLLTCLKNSRIQQQYHFDGSGFRFLYLDLQKRSLKARVDFFDEVHRTVKEYAQAQGYTVAEGYDKDDEFNALLYEFQRRDLYPVLMLDTFDEIIQYQPVSENVFSFLRSQGTGGNLSYIIASVETLNEIFRKLLLGNGRPSPFPNIFATTRLTSFTLQEAETMLIETSARGGLRFTEEEVNWVVQMAGTHPFLIQQVATLLFEEKRARDEEEADYDYIQREVQQNLFDYFEDSWAMLSNKERLAVGEGVHQFEKGQPQSRMYPELCDSVLFRNYLRATEKMITAPLSAPLPHTAANSIEAATYKELLKLLDHPAKLGESVLIGIPLIRVQIEQQQASMPVMRGKIVRQVLKEALERMKGEGQRSETARSWMHYNILYYRYFTRGHDLNQEKIAKRLAMSERQYYRHFPAALERLRNELIVMDAAAAVQARV